MLATATPTPPPVYSLTVLASFPISCVIGYGELNDSGQHLLTIPSNDAYMHHELHKGYSHFA